MICSNNNNRHYCTLSIWTVSASWSVTPWGDCRSKQSCSDCLTIWWKPQIFQKASVSHQNTEGEILEREFRVTENDSL